MIYLDHAATSPLRREALEEMWPYLTADYGNPSSTHDLGLRARRALETARESVARVFGADADEIVFTSGGTESVNSIIAGIALASPRGRQIVTTPVEHEAVLQTCKMLSDLHGFTVDFARVDRDGCVDLDHLRELLTNDTTVCSVIYANNEIGTVNPIAEIGMLCRESSIPFHTDAVQVPGHEDLDVGRLGVDTMNISAHKFGGPKGIGAMYLRSGLSVHPLIVGGGQERGRRSGTENIAGAVGLAAALRSAAIEYQNNDPRLRDMLIDAVTNKTKRVCLTGHSERRLSNHASFTFDGVFGETLLIEFENAGIICSSGSACSAGRAETSHVLDAIGIGTERAQTAIRFSLGYTTTPEEIDFVVDELPGIVERLRASRS